MAAAAAAEEDVKLLGTWVSPFVVRVGIALNLKAVGFEFKEEVFGTKSELLLKSNPVYKKIPVLIHNGKPLAESLIIVQYIDEVWTSSAGPSILPSDPYDRAVARFWAVYIDDKLFPAVIGVLKVKNEEGKAEIIEQISASLQLLEENFVKISKGKPFFGGDTIGYVDIALGCFLGWIESAELHTGAKFLDEAKIPNLISWAQRFRADDAVKGLLLDCQEIFEFSKKLKAKWDAEATK